MSVYMRQCVLRKQKNPNIKRTTWLDDSKISKGFFVRLQGETDWWVIESLSKTRLLKEYVKDREWDYRRTRDCSDI